jgi:hypothetical protein
MEEKCYMFNKVFSRAILVPMAMHNVMVSVNKIRVQLK